MAERKAEREKRSSVQYFVLPGNPEVRDSALASVDIGADISCFVYSVVRQFAERDHPVESRRGWPLLRYRFQVHLTLDNWVVAVLKDEPVLSCIVGPGRLSQIAETFESWVKGKSFASFHDWLRTRFELRDADCVAAFPLRVASGNGRDVVTAMTAADGNFFADSCALSVTRQATWLGLCKTKPTRKEKTESIRAKLAQVVSSEGYDGMTKEEVARKVGLSRARLYANEAYRLILARSKAVRQFPKVDNNLRRTNRGGRSKTESETDHFSDDPETA